MTHFSFLILRLKKPIIGLFTLFCFCQTPYAEKKIEHSICFILKKKLPRSYLQGLKVLSIWTWHIDALILDHPTFGHFEAYDLLAHVKIWPLLFGKSHLESLVIQKLVIQQDKNLSFKPFIFNTIYNNNSFKIDKLYLGFVEAPLIPNPLCIHFSRKPLLNFCEIFDLKSHNSLFLEIPRGSGFLKFKAHLAFSQNMITTHLLGHGYIDQTSHLDLKGDMYIDHYKNKIPLDLYFDFDKIFRASGFASSPEFKGFFHLKSDELLAELELNHLKQTTPQSGFDGSILLKAKGPLKALEITASSEDLFYKRKALAPLLLHIPKFEKSSFEAKGYFLDLGAQKLELLSQFSVDQNKKSLDIQLQGAPFCLKLAGCIDQNKIKNIALQLTSDELNFFEGLLPDNSLLKGQANLIFNYCDSHPSTELFSVFNHVHFNKFKLDQGVISFQESESQGRFDINLKHLSSPYYEPITLNMKGTKDSNWDVFCEFKSSFIDLMSFFKLDYNHDLFSVNVLDLKGSIDHESIKMKEPFTLIVNKDTKSLSPCEIQWGRSKMSLAMNIDKKRSFYSCDLDHIPLRGGKFSYFDSMIDGEMSANFLYNSLNLEKSYFKSVLENFKLTQNNLFFPPLHIHAKARFDENQIHYQLNSYFSNDDYVYLNGNFPIPGKAIKSREENHAATLKLNLLDLGRYCNTGSNSLGGQITADLNIHKTDQKYFTTGHLDIEHLHAGFPLIGLYLDNGHFKLRPAGQSADFQLSAFDFQNGWAKAEGNLNLQNFSYKADCDLERLFINFKDLFSSQVSGQVKASGNLKSIYGQGQLDIEKGLYQLIHQNLKKAKRYTIIKKAQDLAQSPKAPFKFNLDFDVKTKDPLRIKGAGLDSEWSGFSQCLIANKEFGLKGTLNCSKGEYRFQTKKFLIEEGIIHLSDKTPSSILAKGRLDIPTHQIKIHLYGPLAKPKIQFSSLPALGENGILSLILFNKPITQLHPFQSIELAQTLLEFSGEQNPFSLSKIRSNLSVDTLDIRASEDDSNSLTLHVGKYIRPGLLIGLSQSKKASDLLLQLELKHGFLLKAESQEQKEGKFSLKWNKSF